MRPVYSSILSVALIVSIAGMFPGCVKSKRHASAGSEAGRIAALKGEDIPLSDDLLNWSFNNPSEFTEFPEAKMIFRDVYFDYDQFSLKPEVREVLNEVAAYMKDNPQIRLLVEGHCDERGSKEYNLALGEQRALSVRRYLVSLGLSSNYIATVSYGEEQPQDTGHDERSWAKNRRAHFLIAVR